MVVTVRPLQVCFSHRPPINQTLLVLFIHSGVRPNCHAMSAVCLLSLKLSMKHIISILFGFRSWTAIISLLIILHPNHVIVMKLTKNCWQVWKYGLAWSFALWELLVWFVIFYHFLFSPGKKKSTIISFELGHK